MYNFLLIESFHRLIAPLLLRDDVVQQYRDATRTDMKNVTGHATKMSQDKTDV